MQKILPENYNKSPIKINFKLGSWKEYSLSLLVSFLIELIYNYQKLIGFNIANFKYLLEIMPSTILLSLALFVSCFCVKLNFNNNRNDSNKI